MESRPTIRESKMKVKLLRILLVEDNSDDAKLIIRDLQKMG